MYRVIKFVLLFISVLALVGVFWFSEQPLIQVICSCVSAMLALVSSQVQKPKDSQFEEAILRFLSEFRKLWGNLDQQD